MSVQLTDPTWYLDEYPSTDVAFGLQPIRPSTDPSTDGSVEARKRESVHQRPTEMSEMTEMSTEMLTEKNIKIFNIFYSVEKNVIPSGKCPVDHSVDGFPASTAPSVDGSVDWRGSGSGISTSVDVLPYSVAIPSPFRRYSVAIPSPFRPKIGRNGDGIGGRRQWNQRFRGSVVRR